MRDYGTGLWDGGDPDCDHRSPGGGVKQGLRDDGRKHEGVYEGEKYAQSEATYRETCGKCGARRVDQQLGLEPTPDLYVERIVAVFRQVRRVLAPHGTCWVNLGDSYAGSNASQGGDGSAASYADGRAHVAGAMARQAHRTAQQTPTKIAPGLKQKDLVGIPWRVAFALQADGWWLRADIIWAKPNPMPESVTDRPTKAHEYVFLLTKEPRYFFDQEAVREPHSPNTHTGNVNGARNPVMDIKERIGGPMGATSALATKEFNPAGRNVRSVWQIATQPYPEAHFATYPEELVRRCVLAGCPERVCRVCGKPSERIVETTHDTFSPKSESDFFGDGRDPGVHRNLGSAYQKKLDETERSSRWSDCGHHDWRPGTVLDPFIGSGTTCKVARDHGRHSIGIDLSADYLNLAARRLQQLSLLT